ncbi:Gll4071 protein [hydrothermal vent metagenome]|uniref:Gll4071 protein n=1 Tax=hydrothermal vent metagenome TaxID=652676 RepID=A0A3B0S9U4_9ZZZZ
MTETKDITAKSLLDAWRAGDISARDQLFDRLYMELRRISMSLLRREGGVSLSTGDLVNEAVMRLIQLEEINWQDKAHFLALSSRMMRRVLIDHARKKNADKRHHQKVTLVTNIMDGMKETYDIHQLEDALKSLQKIDETRAKIVEMRYFGGLSLEEVAEVMNISTSSVKRSWRVSRAWLLNALE